MRMTENILPDFWRYVKRQDTKIAQRVYDNVLNKDKIGGIFVLNGEFWVEQMSRFQPIPKYAIEYIENWAKSLGYTSIYE